MSPEERFSRLSEACLRISEKVDSNEVLQEVVDSACSLTGARYGVLLTHDTSGTVQDIVSSGALPGELEGISETPEGKGLLGHMNEVNGPLRVSEISAHPRSIGFPANHPAMNNFLGMPINHGNERVGNIYLTDKTNGNEFTVEDEDTIVVFAAQAAVAIANARRYDEERRSRDDLEALVKISPVGVVVFDAQSGDIASLNPEARRMFGGVGLPHETWERGVEVLSYRRADGREFALGELPLTRVLQSGETVRAEEMVISLPDGRSVRALVNAAPISDERGRIRSVVVTLQDMTSLEDIERMRGEFLGLVSQELRTPLTAIKGSVSALAEAIPAHQTELLQLAGIIEQQADLMRGQINSLVELTHIKAGTLRLAQEYTNLADLVQQAGIAFQRAHIDYEIDTSIPTDLPPIMADRKRMAQVLQNLMVHASQRACYNATISVNAVHDDGHVTVTVGCDRENRTSFDQLHSGRLLERINANDLELASDRGGLALAICKGIVEAHGGRIWIEDEEQGDGGTLTFTLPAQDVPTPEPTDGGNASGQAEFAGANKPKILVAIEEGKALAAVRRILSRSGYRPITTFDPADIEELVASERPDLLLLDLSTPVHGVMELVRRIYDEHGLPIVILAERGGDDQIVKAFEMGAEGYVVKPFSSTELVARIQASLRKRSANGGSRGVSNYRAGEMVVDYDSHVVTVAGRKTQLTATEYKLLFELSSNAGRVLTQDELLQRIWGPEYRGEAQLLRAYVKTLRQKLGDNARKPSYIFTEHGIGYRMAKP